MNNEDCDAAVSRRVGCCPCGHVERTGDGGTTRREFLAQAGQFGLLGTALTGLTWATARGAELDPPPPRRPLVVQPIFTYPLPQRQPMASWRNWGGIQSEADVQAEVARIQGELGQLQSTADFPLQFLPLVTVRRPEELAPHQGDIQRADALLFYAGGDGGGNLMANVNHIDGLGKHTVFFVRHKSGPLYYWYEGAMARFLHQHTDQLATKSVGYEDVVVDRLDEVLWRLRALCGLRNTLGSRILAVGGPAGWAQPSEVIAELARERWKLDIQTLTYDELGTLIRDARQDAASVEQARDRAAAYLAQAGTVLETERKFVDNAFLLEQVFRTILARADCHALTINGCMGTIMPQAETTACLTLSLLNDAGFLNH
jgi:hypothetical protein